MIGPTPPGRRRPEGPPTLSQAFFAEPEPTLDVSLIMPVRNEAGFIGRCLDSVLAQQTERISMEVIVVDGESADGTAEEVRRRAAADPRLRLLNNPAQGVSSALNIGLRAARGRVLIRMDAHSIYEPDYVTQSMRLLEETGASAVGGIQTPIPGEDTHVARAIAAAQGSLFGMGGGLHRRAGYEGPAEAVWLGAFRRELGEAVGGFDEGLFRTEDNEFYSRVRAAGGKLWVSYRIRASYICRPTLRDWVRQCFVTGSELVPTLIRSGPVLQVRHLTPGLAMALGLTLAAAGIAEAGRLTVAARAALIGILAVYAGALILSSLAAARHNGGRVLWLLLALFPVAHISYGLGTVWGLLRHPFARRREPRQAA